MNKPTNKLRELRKDNKPNLQIGMETKNLYQDLKNEKDEFLAWTKLSIIADCLRDLGYDLCAKNIMSSPINFARIDKYLSFLEHRALQKSLKEKEHEILERLYYYGIVC
jgi:hypothetical protein